jgi:hypothetical protein
VNALDADQMTAAERLAEIGHILAVGYLRGRNRARDRNAQVNSRNGEVSLDLLVEQSGHAVVENRRGESR